MGLLGIGTIINISQKEYILNPENPCFQIVKVLLSDYWVPFATILAAIL